MASAGLAISALLLAASAAYADPVFALELSAVTPACKTPARTRPRLPAEDALQRKRITYDVVLQDIDGDGWCDLALAVRYPYNSQDDRYLVYEIVAFGFEGGWRRVSERQFRSVPLDGVNVADLTASRFVYPLRKGQPPYVIGLITSSADALGVTPKGIAPGCFLYKPSTVFRWSEVIHTFLLVNPAQAQTVVDFYYDRIDPKCGASLTALGLRAK